MKTRFLNFFTSAIAVALVVAGCEKTPEQTAGEDQFITMSPRTIEATWKGGTFDIAVESNCSWNLSKEDAEGSGVDWVKANTPSGNGKTSFQIRIEENPYAGRTATLTLTCGQVSDFITITQQANPTPVVPDPEPVVYEYYFEFAGKDLGWPVQNATWAGTHNLDSGLALDLETETDNPENLRRKCQVKYTLDGVDYYFTFADPHGATAHQIYLVPEGVHCGGYRYFGLPAIEGKKLVKIEMVQAASNKDATYERIVGVTSWVYNVEDTQAKNLKYVEGGEPQYQNTNGAVYTYELSGTSGNTVYYLAHPSKAGRIASLRLFYTDVDGSEPAPEPEPIPQPKPDEPEPEVPVIPEPENTLKLTFDFKGSPLEGWPTAKHDHVDGGTACVYPLDGKNYTFVLADCDGASACQAFWSPEIGIALNAQYRYLGLPALEGYYLFRVTCTNVKLATNTPKIGITKIITANAAHPVDGDFVTGGEYQTWDANGGGTYSYTLTGTEANKMYYLYAHTKGAVSELELTYAPVK